MDLQVSKWVISVFGENKAFAVFLKILTYGGTIWFIGALLALLFVFKKTRKIAVCAAVAVGLTFLINDFLIKPLVARPRPFVADGSLAQMCSLAELELPDGYSMASGHSAVTMALAVMIMMHSWKLGIPAMVYSLLVGLSRVFLCVHYLTDVLAGFALGAVIAIVLYFAILLILKKYQSRSPKHENNSSGNGQQPQA